MTQQEQGRLTLDAQLCFALYAASRAMTGCYRPLLDGVGLTYPQYLVMLVLWEAESMPVGRLGQRLQLATGTLSPLLRRLEGAGLLTRQRRADDERSVQIDITPAGRALREQVARIQPKVVDATGLTSGELAEMRDTLHELTARLRAAEHRGESG